MKNINKDNIQHQNRGELVYYGVLLFCILLAITQAGCGFYIGIDYTGKTDKSYLNESPDFRNHKDGKY